VARGVRAADRLTGFRRLLAGYGQLVDESPRVPEAESPDARSEEQEVASGRTAATPFFALGSVAFLIACAIALLIGLVVLAMYLA